MLYEGNCYLEMALFRNGGVLNQDFTFDDYFIHNKKVYKIRILGSTQWSHWSGLWQTVGEHFFNIVDLDSNQIDLLNASQKEILNEYKKNIPIPIVRFPKM